MAGVTSVLKSMGGGIARATITLGGRGNVIDAGKSITFELPINPTELSISAQAGEGNKQFTSHGAVHSTMHPHIELHVTAYVDEFCTTDAFVADQVTAYDAFVHARSKSGIISDKVKEHDVSVYVEGLLAALKNDNYGSIWFTWGNMAYGGTLNSVNATYTMFNPMGNPIRAKIDLVIICVSTKETSLMLDWGDKYETAVRKIAQTDNLLQDVSGNLGKGAAASALGRFINF